ncbi:MAG: hypothetical protein KAU95_04120, partial [Candidatus Aenigmarchaeota archaeon]|nr:hypothetical protein [Candidatus Aenigmarchaeota archaeon]
LGLYAENILENAFYKAQKRREEEKEQREVKEFEERTLRELKFYISVLSGVSYNERFENKLEDKLISLRFGEDYTIYCKLPEQRRKEIDEILNLSSIDKKYKEAEEKIDKLRDKK